MDALTLLLIAPLVLAGEAAVLAHFFRRPLSRHNPGLRKAVRSLSGGPLAVVVLGGVWVALTSTALFYEFFLGLMLLYGLVFLGGRIAGAAGLALIGALFLATPVLSGWAVARLVRGISSRPDRTPSTAARPSGSALRST